MANRTNSSTTGSSYEYYLDYLDLVPVDERKLKANKHSIVIAFWASLVLFVVLLFLILLCMSWSGTPQRRSSPQNPPARSWSQFFYLPFCVQRQPMHLGPPGASMAPSSEEEPGSRGSDPEDPLPPESPSATGPAPSQILPAPHWELAPEEDHQGIS
ncbi:melanocortin-2 receptor accessory protein [Echinops telfairi]|uniref:Melanocortin-2 receptor accessory protein n=1 Tax=Echinops telfairi TaxID=9371 RepID=A0ABM0IZB7_ECHTE|nr:melanocortin-2 receptor accessory protein [Echinops telfairi]